jgi:hypothetical protein
MTDRMITPDFVPVMQDSAGYGRQLNPDIPVPVGMRDYSPDILGTLGRIENLLSATYNDSARPRTIMLGPGVIISTHVRYKLNTLVIIGLTPADFFALKIGTAQGIGGPIAAGVPLVLPIAEWVDRGVDICVVDVTTPAATNWTAYLLATEAS